MFKILINDLKHYLARKIRLAKVRSRFPNSLIYNNTAVDSETLLSENVVLFESVNLSRCSVGKHTYIQKYSNLSNVEVGAFCSIASYVTVGLAEHPMNLLSTHPAFYDNGQPLREFFVNSQIIRVEIPRTFIGHDVWIGHGATIKAGLKIGTGSIIATGSVVTKDVPPYSVVGGVPAKLIRYRFERHLIDRLLESNWWLLPENKIRSLAPYFNDPLKFVNEAGKLK